MTNIGNVDSLEKADDLLVELESTKEPKQYLDQVYRIFDIYGVGHGCLHTLEEEYSPSDALWRVTPDDVTNACSNLISKNKHPATRLAKNRHFAFDLFDYRDLFVNEPEVEALYNAFLNNGLEHAYGLPIHTQDQGIYVFVVKRPGSPIEAVELLTLQTICANAINKLKQFKIRPCEAGKPSKISTLERQLLTSIAKGNSTQEICDLLGLTELAIQAMTKNVIQKLRAQNVSHAIVLSLIGGEFELADCAPD